MGPTPANPVRSWPNLPHFGPLWGPESAENSGRLSFDFCRYYRKHGQTLPKFGQIWPTAWVLGAPAFVRMAPSLEPELMSRPPGTRSGQESKAIGASCVSPNPRIEPQLPDGLSNDPCSVGQLGEPLHQSSVASPGQTSGGSRESRTRWDRTKTGARPRICCQTRYHRARTWT